MLDMRLQKCTRCVLKVLRDQLKNSIRKIKVMLYMKKIPRLPIPQTSSFRFLSLWLTLMCSLPPPDVATVSNRTIVEQYQEKVNSTLLEYCSTFYASIRDKFGQLLVRLPEIRLISLRAEDYLYFRHLSGDIPESTLLMEMLHSKRK